MVFQNYALYPHMTVRDNMAFSLELAKKDKASIDERVDKAAEILGLAPLLDRYPAPALGRPAPARRDGPRDRARPAGVPVRRAAVQPRCQAARGDAHRDQGAAPAPAHHLDLRDARPDRGHDDGRPDRRHARRPRSSRSARRSQLYDRPANRFVAGFIGSPAMNFIEGTLARRGTSKPPTARRCRSPPAQAGNDGRAVVYGIRPEHSGHRRRRLRRRGGGRRADRLGDAAVRAPRPAGVVGVFRERHDFAPGQKHPPAAARASACIYSTPKAAANGSSAAPATTTIRRRHAHERQTPHPAAAR